MYICIDFDGTIVDHRYPAIGAPVPGALEAMKKWVDMGAKLILFTVRSGDELDQAVAYIKENGVELFGINHNPDQSSWSDSPKVYAQVYIDDAAFGCPMTMPKGFARHCVRWSALDRRVTAMIALDIERRAEFANKGSTETTNED